MKYELIVRDGIESMNEAVNEMLQDGWQLQGGISVTATDRIYYYCQAMVKHDGVTINSQESITPSVIDLSEFLHSKLA